MTWVMMINAKRLKSPKVCNFPVFDNYCAFLITKHLTFFPKNVISNL